MGDSLLQTKRKNLLQLETILSAEIIQVKIIYNLAISLYTLSIRIAALWNAKARKWTEGRKNIFTKLESAIKPNEKIVWFHCASLGEFEQARTVIEKFRQQNPRYKILLTFFSPSGYEMRKNYEYADYVFYLPADTAQNARCFIEIVQPEIAIFAKYDYWFNYLEELQRKKIPHLVFSAIFRNEQIFFKPYGKRFRNILNMFSMIYVQDEASRKLLRKYKIATVVTVAGDTRYERVMETAEKGLPLPLLEKFIAPEKITIVAGSTWAEDERIILELIKKRKESMKYIIAPHEINRKKIEALAEEIELPVVLYSQANENNVASADILIIDSIGLLAQVYRYGDIAYIGGGFGKGIHNILEPAAFAIPIIFGPNYQKFNEAKELINLGAAFSIDKYRSLNNKINDLFFEKGKIETKKKRIREFMQSKLGATEIVVSGIEKLISAKK